MNRQLWDDIISGSIAGVISGILAGGLLLMAANRVDVRQDEEFAAREAERDLRLSDEQQRLENLRFVREVARAQEGAMPFQSLDLQGMDLSGLRLSCRDGSGPAGSTTTSTAPAAATCFLRADFTGANLSGAIMRDMDLSDAVFAGAELGCLSIEGQARVCTDFGGSDLSRAELAGALNLNAESLEADPDDPSRGGVCYEADPALPDGVVLPPSDNGGNSPICTDGYYAQ
jgi:uncharacterized protein YjbI with pentapeptide repeats